MAKYRIGGSFAPPITAEKLSEYRALAKGADARIQDAMLPLCEMVEVFQQTPDSSEPGHPHPVGRGVIVPLEEQEIKRIWDHVPWPDECELLGRLFETLPDGYEERTIDGARQVVLVDPGARDLRNAAFHLLWYARELTQDREPITNDKI